MNNAIVKAFVTTTGQSTHSEQIILFYLKQEVIFADVQYFESIVSPTLGAKVSYFILQRKTESREKN